MLEASKMAQPLTSALRHAGFNFPYRHPPATGMLEKTLGALGGMLRVLGSALDGVGVAVQGSGGLREQVQPNLAWAPTQVDAIVPPTCGQVSSVRAGAEAVLKQVVMPVKGDAVFIAPNANVLGNVRIGARSSIWYGAVLRGDVNAIEVGSNTSIQDNAIVHVAQHSIDGKPKPTVIGNNVTIGHGATLHACTIEDNVLIGMGATVLDGAVVEKGAIVAAGAIVPPGKRVPANQIWAGNPARFLRDVEEEERGFVGASASNYAQLADMHRFENSKTFEEQFAESAIEVDRYIASDVTNSVHQMWVFDKQTLLAIRPKK